MKKTNTFRILSRIVVIIFLSSSCLYLASKIRTKQNVDEPTVDIKEEQVEEENNVQEQVIIETLDKVPYLSQLPEYPNGCEATASTMVLQYYKFPIKVYQMIDYIPQTPIENHNNKTYGGNPENTFTGSMINKGYGIYSTGITKAINDYLATQNSPLVAKNISGSSQEEIIQLLENGTPVIMWITDDLKPINTSAVHTWYLKEDGKYTNTKITFPLNEHCVVLTKYNNGTLTVHDPLVGIVSRDANKVFNVYNSFNKMAVIIEPK